MVNILEIAHRPAISIKSESTIKEAVGTMMFRKVNALPVIDNGKLVGMISERDLVHRIIAKGLSPEKTKVGAVMTKKVKTGTEKTTQEQALRIMHDGDFRHLPIVNSKNEVLGVLSVKDILKHQIAELDQENKSLAAYVSADGIGG